MTVIQYLSAFRLYGADVLILALGVTLCTSLLKKTVLKKCPKKIYVLLPFVLGLAFYSVYRALTTLSAEPFTNEFAQTVEGGFACGCAATLYYVVYEQFFRTRENLPPVAELLKGIVPEEQLAEAAEEIAAGGTALTAEELFPFVTETLRRYADPPLSEAELSVYAATITEFLQSPPK